MRSFHRPRIFGDGLDVPDKVFGAFVVPVGKALIQDCCVQIVVKFA